MELRSSVAPEARCNCSDVEIWRYGVLDEGLPVCRHRIMDICSQNRCRLVDVEAYPWEEIPHPPRAGGGQVNAPDRSTLQESHFSSNITHNEFL